MRSLLGNLIILPPKKEFMKKIFFYFLLFGSIWIISCKNEGKRTNYEDTTKKKTVVLFDTCNAPLDTCQLDMIDIDIDSCKVAGSGNLIIDPTSALQMIADFGRRYLTGGMKSRYWVDKCGIEELCNFFKQNRKYDGAWVTFGCENTSPYETTIFFVPTIAALVPVIHEAQWADVPSPVGCSAAMY